MAEITNIYARDYWDGESYHDDWRPISTNGTTLTAGYKWQEKNWVMCIKFELPTAAKMVTFSFCSHEDTVEYFDSRLRYKITDNEDSSLFNATSNTVGDGSFSVKNETGINNRTDLTIYKDLSAGIHYIYIWTDDSNNIHNLMRIRWYDNYDGYGFYATYEEVAGCIYIDNGTSFDAYQVYIDNGTSWDLCIPYIDNGSSWDIIG